MSSDFFLLHPSGTVIFSDFRRKEKSNFITKILKKIIYFISLFWKTYVYWEWHVLLKLIWRLRCNFCKDFRMGFASVIEKYDVKVRSWFGWVTYFRLNWFFKNKNAQSQFFFKLSFIKVHLNEKVKNYVQTSLKKIKRR